MAVRLRGRRDATIHCPAASGEAAPSRVKNGRPRTESRGRSAEAARLGASVVVDRSHDGVLQLLDRTAYSGRFDETLKDVVDRSQRLLQ